MSSVTRDEKIHDLQYGVAYLGVRMTFACCCSTRNVTVLPLVRGALEALKGGGEEGKTGG